MTDRQRVAFVVFLDANVLAKPLTRTLVMAAGGRSDYGTTWAAYEEAEADRHVRPGQTAPSRVRVMTGGELAPTGAEADRFAVTSAKDRQVLADAVAAGALFLITEDVDDFGDRDLESAGVAAVNPDLFLSLCVTPEAYLEALTLIAGRFSNPQRTVDQVHVQLGRVHPLTVDAHASLFPQSQPLPATHNPPAVLYRGNRCLDCLRVEDDVRLGLCPKCARLRN